MFFVIQSNDTPTLVRNLLKFYQQNQGSKTLASKIFTPFTVIVPSMVLGDWLTKTVALQAKISTLITVEFWGKYQWQMMKWVLECDAKAYPQEALSVPEVAVLSASIMRWRLFGFLSEKTRYLSQILATTDDPLRFLLLPLVDNQTHDIAEHRLWQVCDELSRVYVRYLTHRPDWLLAWTKGESLADVVQQMMADKARFERVFDQMGVSAEREGVDDKTDEIPEWLQEHYLALEKVLGMLWKQLFAETYHYRLALEERFWQVLAQKRGQDLAHEAYGVLPKKLYMFTVQQIPQVELEFLKRLSVYLDVVLLHFNPSMAFWADIVDKNWLLSQQIINPDSVYLKDYGHGLLSRLGKESRETFAMLADMSGGEAEHIVWQDEFVSPLEANNPTVLNALKQDILMLHQHDTKSVLGVELWQALTDEQFDNLSQKVRPKTPLPFEMADDSLSIHACHSLKRQLEIARLMIGKYLNKTHSDGKKRALSDVVVLLPDVQSAKELIYSVFPEGCGADGLSLPITITGTPDENILELVRAIAGFYHLLGDPSSRFYAQDVFEWLLMPAIFENFGLSFEQMQRGCQLLTQAGFKRGFDEQHLSATLNEQDWDYRYSFSYALDRIVLGLVSPSDGVDTSLYPFKWHKHIFAEAVLPLVGVQLEDEPIILALTAIHQALAQNRHQYTKINKVQTWLDTIEHEIIARYFGKSYQSIAMRAIFNAKNSMMASLRANKYYHRHIQQKVVATEDIYLSLKFVLQSLEQTVQSQAVSAEPSQTITFARFGALRSIPFGLTIMVQMDLAAFPRQDKAVRLDLMRAGLSRRGDRYNEDDDNGAFLDALLCTKDQVMIFYTGKSADGKTALLPASPVGELLEFLKTEAVWQTQDILKEGAETQEIHRAIELSLPSLIEDYLVTYHQATAFDEEVFFTSPALPMPKTDDVSLMVRQHFEQRLVKFKEWQSQSLPPPPLWCSVRAVLDQDMPAPQTQILPNTTWLTQLAQQLTTTLQMADMVPKPQAVKAIGEHVYQMIQQYGIEMPSQERLETLVSVVKNFAKTYVADKVHVVKSEEIQQPDEPLALDGLGRFHVYDMLVEMVQAGVFDQYSPLELSDEHIFDVIHALKMQDGSQQKSLLAHKAYALYYGDILPAGKLRLSAPSEQLKALIQETQEFVQLLQHLMHTHQEPWVTQLLQIQLNLEQSFSTCEYSCVMTKLVETQVALPLKPKAVLMSEKLPVADSLIWIRVLPNSANAGQLFGFWLKHLLWQVARQTSKADIEQGKGTSIWRFYRGGLGFGEEKTFVLPPIDHVKALAQLANVMVLGHIAKRTPLVITIRESWAYLAQSCQFDQMSASEMFRPWLHSDNDHDESWCRHQYWRLVLSQADPLDVLIENLVVAVPVFEQMYQSLYGITAKKSAVKKSTD